MLSLRGHYIVKLLIDQINIFKIKQIHSGVFTDIYISAIHFLFFFLFFFLIVTFTILWCFSVALFFQSCSKVTGSYGVILQVSSLKSPQALMWFPRWFEALINLAEVRKTIGVREYYCFSGICEGNTVESMQLNSRNIYFIHGICQTLYQLGNIKMSRVLYQLLFLTLFLKDCAILVLTTSSIWYALFISVFLGYVLLFFFPLIEGAY